MIKSLSINNYALIQSLELAPSQGLSIITGETGAGKSIMLGALGLLMGNRADSKTLWDTEKKCVVEAIIDIEEYPLKNLFEANSLEYEIECILRREILPSGKSRAFINDTPVNLALLKELSPYLMDIHSQHDGLLLGAEQYQLNLLDTYAAHKDLVKNYAQVFNEYKHAAKSLSELESAAQLSAQEEDYKRFILNELQEIDLEGLDIQSLENELTELENAEEILIRLSEADQLLDQSETSVLLQLQGLTQIISKLSQLSANYESYAERLASANIELKDIHADLYAKSEQIAVDPSRLQIVKQTVDNYHRLMLKHKCAHLQELIDLKAQIETELNLIDNREGEIVKAKTLVKRTEAEVYKTGKLLTKSRFKNAHAFSKEIEEIIHQLGIENGNIQIKVSSKEPTKDGMDQIQFLFSANKGIDGKPIKDVASGGEFSRLIFAIKYLIAQKTALPTIVFDEIDTGVSGEVANKMISFMRQMSENHQIISISHLPQFAAGGDCHFYVYKDNSNDKTKTKIKLLDAEERVTHIARMIAGDDVTSVTIDNARELLKH